MLEPLARSPKLDARDAARSRTRLSSRAALVVLLSVAAARAGDPAPPAPAVPAARSLGALAAAIAHALGNVPAGARVLVSAPSSDEAAPRAVELGARVASLVAGALGRGASVATAPARRDGATITLEIEIAHGELRVAADARETPTNTWARALAPRPAPVAHAFGAMPIDAEVRAFLATVPAIAARVERVHLDDRELVALACGDVGGDGSIEIAAVSRRRVTLGRVRGGRFVTLAERAWGAISKIAPFPLREPLAGAVVHDGVLDVGSTDRARGARLDASLATLAAFDGVPVPSEAGVACARYEPARPAPTLGACAPGDAATTSFAKLDAADLVAARAIVGRDGRSTTFAATRDPARGDLSLVADGRSASIAGVGAELELADLDADGELEVAYGLDVPRAADDALVVASWRPGDAPRERARVPVAGGVRAIAACPPDGPSAAPLLVATSGELWIVR